MAKAVAIVLRQARTDAGMTQDEVAAKAGIDRSYLSDVERGEGAVSLEVFLGICQAIGVSASDVLSRIEV